MNSVISLRTIALFAFFFSQSWAFAQSDSIQHDGRTRYFKMHFPTGYGTQESYALVVALHGGLGSGPQLETQSQLSVTANEKGFIVVYPDGVVGPLNIRTWNAGECCGYASENNIDDVGFIKNLIDTLEARYSIDHTKIFVTGMSNGGFMAYRLACELQYLIAAIAPVASTMNTNCAPKNWVPTIHFHSYLDSNVPYAGGRGDGLSNHYNPPIDSIHALWAKASKCETFDSVIDKGKYDKYSWKDCDCDAEYQLYISYDGGHSWPNGRKSAIGDPVSTVLFASALMWEFFEKHPKCEMVPGGMEEKLNLSKIIYPNPVRDELEISIPEKIKSIRITNNGSEVMKFESPQSPESLKKLNVRNLPAGYYILELQLQNSVQTHPFIKID